MYNYLKNSGSLYREYIGENFYDNHWDKVLNYVSSSSHFEIISGSTQIDKLDTWLKESNSTWKIIQNNIDLQNGNN